MDFNTKSILGRTGLKVGRLGISSSFGAPANAYEEAFERGCNYFTIGTFIRGRSNEMKKSIKNIIEKGNRENLVLAAYTYAHSSYLTEKFLMKGMKDIGVDYFDVLLLGYFSRMPNKKIIDGAVKLKDNGLVRFLGVSGHNRKLFIKIEEEKKIDVFHVRYNAANNGAETDIFNQLNTQNKPGIVSFTATRWRQLLNPNKMPKGESALSAVECYRYVLTNPSVDVCMMGAKNSDQMRDNFATLDKGPLNTEELVRVQKIGDFVYGR